MKKYGKSYIHGNFIGTTYFGRYVDIIFFSFLLENAKYGGVASHLPSPLDCVKGLKYRLKLSK
jgi:hypothetical protein